MPVNDFLPGAAQMQYGVRLALSRPWLDRVPASTGKFVKGPASSGLDMIRACKGVDGSWAFLYCPNCQKVRVDLNQMSADRVKVSYFSPRTGATVSGGEVEGRKEESFQPPFDPNGRDWVVILDDLAKGYPAP